MIALAASLAAHLMALLALLWTPSPPAPPAEPAAVSVDLVGPVALTDAPSEAAPGPSAAAGPRPAPKRPAARPAISLAPSDTPASPDFGAAAVGEAELAGAASADSGGGAECDMAARVQAALRRDPLVKASLTDSAHGATRVWNGDWVRSPGQDGKGLAAVREAIMWEIAFAPPACRSQPVRGLVLFTVAGPSGASRLVVGADHWRWSDLLKVAGRI